MGASWLPSDWDRRWCPSCMMGFWQEQHPTICPECRGPLQKDKPIVNLDGAQPGRTLDEVVEPDTLEWMGVRCP